MHSHYLQLGRLHFPVFGVFAALGLMAALTLSQRTARYVTLSPEAVWNAGVTAIISTFVFSRLLLIAFNFHSFLQYPLLILALPSLTITGILLAAIFMLGYVRWRKLPLLPLLDAVTPCVALVWAFLSLGRYFEGTRDGMPTPYWPTRAQPVEIYTALAAFFVFFRMWSLLRKQHAKPQVPAGTVAAIALVVSGFSTFFIDFLRLPSELFDRSPLEGSQIMGIAMILVGIAIFMRARLQITQESGNEPPHAI